MTTIQEAIFQKTSTFPGLVPFVATRVYPVRLPENVIIPAIRYFRVSEVENATTHDGGILQLVFTRFQFDFFSEDVNELEQIGDQLAECWTNFQGVISGLFIGKASKVDRGTAGTSGSQGWTPKIDLWNERIDFTFNYRRN